MQWVTIIVEHRPFAFEVGYRTADGTYAKSFEVENKQYKVFYDVIAFASDYWGWPNKLEGVPQDGKIKNLQLITKGLLKSSLNKF